MPQLILTSTQKCPVSVVAKDKRGQPAKVEGPSWEVNDPAVMTFEQDPADPLKGTLVAQGAGTGLLTFKADADLTDGTVEIVGTLDVVVGAGQATVIEITAGTPVEQDSAAR